MRITAVAGALLLATSCGAEGRIAAPVHLHSFGRSGQAPGELDRPTGIALHAEGNVFVGDTGNDRVQVFDAEGRFLYAFGESGDGPGQFLRPMDLDVDRDGRVFVADFGGDRIQVFTPRGQLVRTIRGEQSSAGSFDGAAGVLVAPDGDVYVADFYHHRVVRFHSSDGHTSILGRPGRILPGRLNYPTDLAWAGGQLLVADAYNNRVQVLSPEGDPVTRWGGPLGLGAPGSWGGWFRVATGIATDSRERVYVADFENHRIQVFDATGHLLTLFGSQGSGPGEFERPTDLDVGADGRIYVVDFGNDRIQVFSPFGDDDP